MAELKMAVVMAASLSAPITLVSVAPMMLDQPLATGDPVEVVMEKYEKRTLSNLAIYGRNLYQESCVDCHGMGAAGTQRGPDLIQPAYHRSAFGKRSFHAAVKAGVVEKPSSLTITHQFPELSFNQVERLERYIRELQQPMAFR